MPWFSSILSTTGIFLGSSQAYLTLDYIDLDLRNIIVNNDLNLLGLIDWESAQTARWHVRHYPTPFPLLWPDAKIKNALLDPGHL